MKLKIPKVLWLVFICAATLFFCLVVYLFMDNAMNGVFMDWFDRNYMITESRYVAEPGWHLTVREPDYESLKRIIFILFTGNVLFWTLSITAAVHFYARARLRKSVTQISRLIRDFMEENGESAEVFPKEYAEISAQMTEIRARRQRQEQMLKDEAARKNDLIAYLAHDLKTPLTSVIGYLSLLDEAADMPDIQREKYIHVTLDKAFRLERLINEFFDITRYNLQKIEVEKETFDLYYMLVQMTDEFYPVLQRHKNTVELNVPEDLEGYGDAAKLARVFNNILKNAVAYSYQGTEIEIEAEEDGENLRVYFKNRGPTIPSHKLESIFEKFFRLDETRSTDTGGAGLGLAIAKEIVTLHGGSITASSENELTAFCVALPARR